AGGARRGRLPAGGRGGRPAQGRIGACRGDGRAGREAPPRALPGPARLRRGAALQPPRPGPRLALAVGVHRGAEPGVRQPALPAPARPCRSLWGPCERWAPAPELPRELRDHARAGRPIEPVPFPPEAVTVLAALLRWKVSPAAQREPPAALYRLHVLEVETLE